MQTDMLRAARDRRRRAIVSGTAPLARALPPAPAALLPLLLLPLLALPIAGCEATPARTASGAGTPVLTGPDPLVEGRYALEVLGMSCPKCISNVDLQLARIAGVGEVEVDMKNGLVTLAVAPGAEVARARIADAIADAGFTLRAVRAGAAPAKEPGR